MGLINGLLIVFARVRGMPSEAVHTLLAAETNSWLFPLNFSGNLYKACRWPWSFGETSSEKAYICLFRRILKKADNLEKKLKNILDLSSIAASLLYL